MKTLKRIAIVLAALILFAGNAEAKILNFGIKAGVNVNKLHFNKEFAQDLISNDNSTGWEAGVMAEANVPLIGLCFDVSLMYARMNNNTQAYTQNMIFNGKEAGRNFLMLPINIKYKFNFPAISRYLSPFVFTGPDFAFKLDKNTLQYMKTKTCQIAWNVGLGVQLIRHLQIAASYGFGINNIADKMGANTVNFENVKNNYWTVTAAWLF